MANKHFPHSFLDDLFEFLDEAIASGKEVHIVDRSEPGKDVEHVFNSNRVEKEHSTIACEDEIPFADEDICPYDGDCSQCPYENECAEDLMSDCSGECYGCLYNDMWGIPNIDHIVFSGPATIVFWTDGTKTVVKCMPGEKFERYAGFMAACMKKMFGSTSRAKAVMEQYAVEQVLPEKTKKAEQITMFSSDSSDTYSAAMDKTIKEAVDEALER